MKCLHRYISFNLLLTVLLLTITAKLLVGMYPIIDVFTSFTFTHLLTYSLNSSISNKNNRDVLLSMNSLIDNAVAYMTSKNPSKNKNHIR